jgi:hypothetical protein
VVVACFSSRIVVFTVWHIVVTHSRCREQVSGALNRSGPQSAAKSSCRAGRPVRACNIPAVGA